MRHKTLLLAVEPMPQGKTPGRLGTTIRSTPLHRKIEPRKLRSYESSRQSLTRIASALFADGLEKYIGRSSETQSLSSPSAISLEQARTSWRRQCCCVICQNHQIPKHDTFEMRCRLCSR